MSEKITTASTTGKLAAQEWLRARALSGPPSWHVEVTLDVRDGEPGVLGERTETRFRIEIYSEEWGFFFCHAGKASWIRVTDIAFVHGRDDFRLLANTPALENLGTFVRAIELEHRLRFRREHAAIRTNLVDALVTIKTWIAGL